MSSNFQCDDHLNLTCLMTFLFCLRISDHDEHWTTLNSTTIHEPQLSCHYVPDWLLQVHPSLKNTDLSWWHFIESLESKSNQLVQKKSIPTKEAEWEITVPKWQEIKLCVNFNQPLLVFVFRWAFQIIYLFIPSSSFFSKFHDIYVPNSRWD